MRYTDYRHSLFGSCFAMYLLACAGSALAAGEVAMLTVALGKGNRSGGTFEAFAKLRADEEIQLNKGARAQLVYFETGRVECWKGAAGGKLKVGRVSSEPTDLPAPDLRELPVAAARQIARAPVFDAEGNVVTSRYRSIPTPSSIAAVEEQYRKLRVDAPPEDISPELYLLSGMFELQELGRVEEALAGLKKERPQDPQVKLLASLYGKAIRDARNIR